MFSNLFHKKPTSSSASSIILVSASPSLATGAGLWGPPAKYKFDPPEIKDGTGIYHLFAGEDYYPREGLGDYIGVFKSLADAFARYEAGYENGRYIEKYEWGVIATVNKNKLLIPFLEYRADAGTRVIHIGWKKPISKGL